MNKRKVLGYVRVKVRVRVTFVLAVLPALTLSPACVGLYKTPRHVVLFRDKTVGHTSLQIPVIELHCLFGRLETAAVQSPQFPSYA